MGESYVKEGKQYVFVLCLVRYNSVWGINRHPVILIMAEVEEEEQK